MPTIEPGVTGTLDGKAVAALRAWVRSQGIGTDVTDVVPLAGGSQNVVVRLKIDGRSLVLRRPPPHPRPNSDRTMQREIAVLRTLAGGAVSTSLTNSTAGNRHALGHSPANTSTCFQIHCGPGRQPAPPRLQTVKGACRKALAAKPASAIRSSAAKGTAVISSGSPQASQIHARVVTSRCHRARALPPAAATTRCANQPANLPAKTRGTVSK